LFELASNKNSDVIKIKNPNKINWEFLSADTIKLLSKNTDKMCSYYMNKIRNPISIRGQAL
jgi:hypothetical protein